MRRSAYKVFTSCALTAIFLFTPALAGAFSQSDTAFYDGYGDLAGLDPARSSNVALDILGGVRLTTVGVPVTATWTSQADFTAPAAPLGPVIGLTTLDAATAPGSLQLAQTPLAFRRGSADPVLAAPPAVSPDGYGVGGMCVARVNLDKTYYMWFTGVPEDGWKQRLYLAKSDDGKTWVKEALPINLPLGDPGSFDSRQIFRPSVLYDANATPKLFKMWYSAEGDFGGSIGYATSEDGVTWTKVVGPDGLTNEVLPKGDPGTADGYSCSQPSVLLDGDTYHMWYTASDANNVRIAYATSSDGIVWQKGGVVVDIGPGNTECGAYSPTVWKSGTKFEMILAGCKTVAGTDEPQTKLISKESSAGTIWSQGSIEMSGASGDWFDGYNLSQPWVLPDPDETTPTHRFKMWYVGNNPDANGNYHDRIGYAHGTNGTSWARETNGAAVAPNYGAWLTLGTQSPAFDSMNTADLRLVQEPGEAGLLGFYTGVNAIDFKPRIGVKRSLDGGSTWTDVLAPGAPLISVGAAGDFDEAGAARPAPSYPVYPGGLSAPNWIVYYTATNASGANIIGYRLGATLDSLSGTGFLGPGAGFDSAGAADPYAVDAFSSLAIYYAGKNGAGIWSIGKVTAGFTSPYAPVGHSTTALAGLTPTAGSYDAGGLRSPVVLLRGGTWYLWYTAIDAFGDERTALATSPDGTTWTKRGLAIVPSSAAYDFTEAGVRPAGAWDSYGAGEVSLTLTGIDRFGWTRCGLATATGAGFVESGSAAFELAYAAARDWRQILWTEAAPPAGTTSEVWVSYYPTANGDWSNAFQLASSDALPFLLNVQKLRWQVRMTSADTLATPILNDLSVVSAPVVFPASGQAVTVPVGPPPGRYLLSWGDMTVKAETSGSAGLTVTVLDASGFTLLPARAVNGATTIALGSANPPVSPTSGPLSLVFTFSSDSNATALLTSVGASFTSTNIPSAITLAASAPLLVSGGSATLAGVLTANSLPAAGQPVVIKARTPIEAIYTTIGTATTLADGSFSISVAPTAITVYRAEWAGGTLGGVACPPAGAGTQINVSPAITQKLTNYTSRRGAYRYPLGRKVIATGTIAPSHYLLADGVTLGRAVVTLSKYTYSRTTRKFSWVKMKDISVALTSTSAFKFGWRPRVRARYQLQTSFAGDLDHAAGAGKAATVLVY